GTSITSGGDGVEVTEVAKAYLPENPQIRYANWQRGYVSCQVTPGKWTSHYRILDKVSIPDQPIQTKATFITEAGKPGAVKV
ncbi:MAG: alkaline phosphatase, partial [Acidobacteria bacterium]|nr:alkaline phosphatase [Acidobacteriota bacterium]